MSLANLNKYDNTHIGDTNDNVDDVDMTSPERADAILNPYNDVDYVDMVLPERGDKILTPLNKKRNFQVMLPEHGSIDAPIKKPFIQAHATSEFTWESIKGQLRATMR
jgi:hypothetical protein